jgi:pimeloyl-ACP methyl ester carboxylesterase
MIVPARSPFARAAETSSQPRDAPPPALLLHGQPGAGRDWHAVLAALDGHVAALAPDRPGWDGVTEARDLEGNARAAVAWLDEFGGEPATIVGHSLGAAIAVLTALQAPERVAALVLAAPAANAASLAALDRWLALPGAGEVFSGASLTGLGLALSTGAFRRRLETRSGLPDSYLKASGRALLSGWARRAFMVEQRTLVRDLPNLEARLHQIRTPTWIVTGSADRIVPVQAPQELAQQIPGAHLIELPGAGHLLPQLQARELADIVLGVVPDGSGIQRRTPNRQASSSQRRPRPI